MLKERMANALCFMNDIKITNVYWSKVLSFRFDTKLRVRCVHDRLSVLSMATVWLRQRQQPANHPLLVAVVVESSCQAVLWEFSP